MASSLVAGEFHVAPSGSDSKVGNVGKPIPTLNFDVTNQKLCPQRKANFCPIKISSSAQGPLKDSSSLSVDSTRTQDGGDGLEVSRPGWDSSLAPTAIAPVVVRGVKRCLKIGETV